MKNTFSQTSENTLFSILIAAAIGFTVVSVANAATPATDSVACTVAKIAAGISHS